MLPISWLTVPNKRRKEAASETATIVRLLMAEEQRQRVDVIQGIRWGKG